MSLSFKNYASLRLLAAIAFIVLFAGVNPLSAQTAGNRWASWWFGGYVGGNINIFSGRLVDLDSNTDAEVAQPPDNTMLAGFDKGTGFGLAIGGLVEYNSGGLLGGNLWVGYDNRAITYSEKNAATDVSIGRVDENLNTSL